jgi:hypothetical protein
VVDRPLAEEVARGEARVPRADDDRGDALDGRASDKPPRGPPSGDFDGDVRRVRERVEHGGALLGLGDQRLDLLPRGVRVDVNVTLMSLKPLRTSLSAPRIPRMSCPPSTVDSTERSWMPRFCATDATPAGQAARQADEEVLDRRDAVVLRREDLGVVGVERPLFLVALLLAEAEEVWTLIVLWTPFCHLDDARQVNWAASGAPFSTSRASSSA